MTPEIAYAAYKDYQARFDAVGIPWNQKGSPHGLRLKALRYLRQVPFSHIVSAILRERMDDIADNIENNNALYKRMTALHERTGA